MGKPKKDGFPAMEPKTNYVSIQNGKMESITIAWGDAVVWQNQDRLRYQIAQLGANGEPDPASVWATVGPQGAPDENTQPVAFSWTESTPPPDQPHVFQYGLVGYPGKATITAQIKV
jgi:hypothetical protein